MLDFSFPTAHAPLHGKVPQEHGVSRGIKMKRVGNARQRGVTGIHRSHKTLLFYCLTVQGVGIDIRGFAGLEQLQPIVVERYALHVFTHVTKSVQITLTNVPPVDELDAQLEGSLSTPNKLILIQPEHLIEQLNWRNGRLTHADRADGVRLHQLNVAVLVS